MDLETGAQPKSAFANLGEPDSVALPGLIALKPLRLDWPSILGYRKFGYGVSQPERPVNRR
jgi:hypothetical protein